MAFPIPLPSVSLNVSLGGRSKQSDKKEELTKSSEAPIQMGTTVDPVMLLMAVAMVLMAAMLAYASKTAAV